MTSGNYLVFDIETVARPIEEFDASQQEYLLRGATTEEEIQQKISQFALSPFTGKIASIGLLYMSMFNEEWNEIKIGSYTLDESMSDGEERIGILPLTGAEVKYFNEKTLLENFWEIFKKSNPHLISFNGRNFDSPFLMLRSGILGVRPTRNLMEGTKFNYPHHYDLIDELSFYMNDRIGPARRFNLDFYTKAFGIESPKTKEVNGSVVTELFNEGKIEEIADYCLKDIRATWELFLRWQKYLQFN